MSKALKTLLLLAAAFTGAHSMGDDSNSNNQWPSMPFWFSSSGNMPPAGPNENNATNPFAFRAYLPPQAPNGQPWLNPYVYQLFGQQPPFGFGPAPAQMFYGGMQGQPQPIPGTAVLPPLSENNHMSVDTPTHLTATVSLSGQGCHINAVPSSSRAAHPETGMSATTGTAVSPMIGKGNPRCRARNWSISMHWRRTNVAERQIGKRMPHVVDMQMREFEEHRPDPMVNMLCNQISMNVELMRRCEELEKMLSKRQLSPDRRQNQSSKCHWDSCPSQLEHRCQLEEYDNYLVEDEDYPTPCRQWRDVQWRDRGHGGSFSSQGWEQYAPGRTRESRLTKPPVDVITLIPCCEQHLPEEDKHDAMLDSYDQLYPQLPLAKRSFPDIMDSVGSGSEDDGTPMDVVAQANLFVAWCNRRLCNLGRLPLWLHTYQPEGLPRAPDKQDNSFWGMYGPGFMYDLQTNIMYTEHEAIDAARALTDGIKVHIPLNITHCPNPWGFPMNIQEVQKTVNYIHLQQTSNGSVANGAGLTAPVNGSLDDWCQYTALHFCPGGQNPTRGIIMDMLFHVSFASVWGMLMLHFLHPTNAKNYYARYLAGIIFCPQYYMEFIWHWNCDRTDELPVSIATGSPIFQRMVFHGAGENLSELDVVHHLASCVIMQEMLDSTYPWALAWINQHSNVHFQEANRQLELECQLCLQQHSTPVITDVFQGWWSPDIRDTHWICTLLYYERFEYQPTGCVHTQDNQFWLLCGKDALFTWLNKYPPSLPTINTAMSPKLDDDDVPMTPDEVSTLDDTTAKPVPNSAADEADMMDDVTKAAMPDIITGLDQMHLASGYNMS
ncbi:hypothetical protein ARMGADRAFT_1038729 [Armillaria gallica]|uniref:Uncharacterized protein n=1 Tax=Armillaria gallica TaxID=47427 RepID=A0A2H3CGP5_ARMGA|nr:hypothetical protein ARMGADRAFT_1038729 [Armillaria gallica]